MKTFDKSQRESLLSKLKDSQDKRCISIQKNGKGFVQVCGTVYEGRIRSVYGNRKVESYYSDYNCPKLETLVTIR